MTSGTFTGRHATIILVAFFGVVITVNMIMATLASRTFGGLVVENSYVASQRFNGWLREARAEKALGWTLSTTRAPDGRLIVTLGDGGQGAISGAQITAIVRHPLGATPERTLSFVPRGAGQYESTQALPVGRWILHFEAKADGRTIRRIVDLQ